jgi:hypothetical protein
MDARNLEARVIKVSFYTEFNDVLILTAFEVIWRLEKEDSSYTKFKITKLEYKKAEKF